MAKYDTQGKLHEELYPPKHETYTFKAELGKDQWTSEKLVSIEAVSEERAREFAEHILEDEYPGEQGYLLLSLTRVEYPE